MSVEAFLMDFFFLKQGKARTKLYLTQIAYESLVIDKMMKQTNFLAVSVKAEGVMGIVFFVAGNSCEILKLSSFPGQSDSQNLKSTVCF